MGKSTDIGTRHTTNVIRFLRANGFPQAELRNLAGSKDKGDIVGTPGIVWECKAGNAAETASDLQVEQWMVETEVERCNAGEDYGVLVLKRRAIGPANAGRYWAILPVNVFNSLMKDRAYAPVRMHLQDAVTLLRVFGYGDDHE